MIQSPSEVVSMIVKSEILLEERRTALKAVLESKEFSRAPALAKLLTYLCEKTFEGRVHEIKEFSIATEVYSRNESFGEKRDSIVRVEMSRLRKRLRNYYENEGADQVVRIIIPAGRYEPEFEQATPSPESPPVDIPPIPAKRSNKRTLIVWIALPIVLALATLIMLFRAPRQAAVTPAP